MNRSIILATGLILLVLLAVSYSSGDDEVEKSINSSTTILISTSSAEVLDLPMWFSSVGRVHSVAAPTLAAEVEGRVTKVTVDAGESIEQGQLLAEIDTSTLILKRRAALAGIERLSVHIANGERRVDRFDKLSSQNLSSQTQLDDAREQLEAFKADYKAAEAELALVNDSLAKSRIVSPVSGVIQQRMISEGDFVKRGQALFQVTDPSRLQAWLPYPESEASRIRIGQPVIVKSLLTNDTVYEGSITEIQPAIGLGSRALMTITDIDQPGDLRPEATINGRVLIETRPAAVTVPDAAVVRRPSGEVVYVINGELAQARQVTIGHIQNGRVEILTGLKGGETVASEGAAFLTDGALVKVTEPDVESS